MSIEKEYDLLIIGGGISASVFTSNVLKNKFNGRIALIESGRSFGGRSSTRISKRFKTWKLNHGSPNFNIHNRKNNSLINAFLEDLLKENLIKFDNSEFLQLSNESKLNTIEKSEFCRGEKFISTKSMSDLSKNMINLYCKEIKIDFYFGTLINQFKYVNNQWILSSKSGDKFRGKFLICSSNLVLHKRSVEIFNTDKIPLRKAIPEGKDKEFDLLLRILDKQLYIPRLTFLIYTKRNYNFKDIYLKDYRYFYLEKDLENKYKFERVVFQLQGDKKLGIVVHSKSLEFMEEFLNEKSEIVLKKKIFTNFNDLFDSNCLVNRLSGEEDISIMRWRASQPTGIAVPYSLQFFRNYNIGFCGDWFEGIGFGRIEGAIFSALKLANIFKSLN